MTLYDTDLRWLALRKQLFEGWAHRRSPSTTLRAGSWLRSGWQSRARALREDLLLVQENQSGGGVSREDLLMGRIAGRRLFSGIVWLLLDIGLLVGRSVSRCSFR